MNDAHKFGGPWTEQKLKILKGYLEAYRRIFTMNARARYFTTIYVDAFAGTGSRLPSKSDEILVDTVEDRDADAFRRGSARIALELEYPFDQYVFIEKNARHAARLGSLRKGYPRLDAHIHVLEGDANEVLATWCGNLNTRRERAVVFLDPYGMQVEWPTIEAIAETKACDMWLLFPLGMGVNRLLTKNRLPNPAEAERLTKTFGTEAWRGAFYTDNLQDDLFGTASPVVKRTNFDEIASFFLKRLDSVFADVANAYLPLYNSTNVPIYMLCFAAANEKGAKSAIRIATHLLKQA